MQTTLTIDLGGTNIRAAKISNGCILAHHSMPCKAQGTQQEVLEQVYLLIDRLIDTSVEGIGIGIPSIVDTAQGIVYDVVNIPSWREVPLRACLQERYHCNVQVDNDVNCFILGETHFGCVRGLKDVVGLTLGTGVGAGIVINGALYRGLKAGAGEVGCLPYLDSCYETYCSSGFFTLHHTTGALLARQAEAGEAEARRLWGEFGFHLGKLLQAVFYTYAPQAVVIGGGIAASSSLFDESMRTSLHDGFTYPNELAEARIHFSTLEHCNLLGAACLF